MDSTSDMRHTALLALGSSLGDRLAHLRFAVGELDGMENSSVVAASHVYRTAPAGGVAKEDFFNACLELETTLSPRRLLEACLAIETSAGRKRERALDDRTLDIDILLYDDLIQDEKELIIPHPHFEKRKFVMQPLFDIAPDFVDPKSGLKIRELLGRCEDPGDIERLPFPINS